MSQKRKKFKESANEKSQTWDAGWGFPRPANEQYLSSYKAFLRISKDFSLLCLSVFFYLLSFILTLISCIYLISGFRLNFFSGKGIIVTGISVFIVLVVSALLAFDISSIILPYRLEYQRETYGGRTWANVRHLKNKQVLVKNGHPSKEPGVCLASFKKSILRFGQSKYQIFLDVARLSQSIVIYGPPGSGKSSTFFIPVIRQFADFGGAIVLDVKGELYNYTARYFSNIYRLDLENPLNSDWFDLFQGCYRNPDRARRIAGYMVGYDSNKNSSKDPIWDQSAVSMLTCIILILCEDLDNPSPNDILTFLAENPKFAFIEEPGSDKRVAVFPLNEAFEACQYDFVRHLWANNFSTLAKDTFTSVKFNVDNSLSQFLSPKAAEVMRPPTAEELKKGRRKIDFADLRKTFTHPVGKNKKGSAMYVVVSPSDALNMDTFLRVVFSVTLDTLRESVQDGTPVLVALDEAGNVPLSKLPEGINTDRSKKICYFLGYQDINQPKSQYGRETAASFLATVGTNIFLPGIDDETAEIASKRVGETTAFQRSSADAKNDGYDNEKVSEIQRKLMYPQDFTTAKWFTQTIITLKGIDPIRTKIPDDSKITDPQTVEPLEVVSNPSDEVLRILGRIETGRPADNVVPVGNGAGGHPNQHVNHNAELQDDYQEIQGVNNSVLVKSDVVVEDQVTETEKNRLEQIDDNVIGGNESDQDIPVFADQSEQEFDEDELADFYYEDEMSELEGEEQRIV